jgi:CubicO group peptidase (beta-lactamase class C family)
MGSQVIQTALDRAVAAGVATGLTAAVARADGSDEFFAAGVRGVADPAPMDPDTLFWIASCTKAITSAAALQLVDRGVLNLDEPVGARLPALAAPRVLEGFDPDGTPKLRPARKPVTLRHLLTHTSGLAYDFFHADLGRYYAATGGSLATAAGAPLLVFEPGEGWQYGTGIDAAAWLIEAAVGRDFGEHLDDAVLRPLGMTDTTFEMTPALEARAAGMHARAPDGTLSASGRFPAAPEFRGGGGLYSTARDYLKFLRAVLGDGSGVFSPAVLAMLREDQGPGRNIGRLITAAPPLSHDFEALPGVEKRWTLGFLRNEADVPGARRAGSLAWAGLANCYYWADPASGVAGLVFAQHLPFADPKVLGVFEAVERAAYLPCATLSA